MLGFLNNMLLSILASFEFKSSISIFSFIRLYYEKKKKKKKRLDRLQYTNRDDLFYLRSILNNIVLLYRHSTLPFSSFLVLNDRASF